MSTMILKKRNGDYCANCREGDWKLIYRWQIDSLALYNLSDDPTETNDLAPVESARVLRMARGMARRFDAEWPTYGALSTAGIMGSLDLDRDGLTDAAEEINANGLQDPGETDPDNPDSDGDGIGQS